MVRVYFYFNIYLLFVLFTCLHHGQKKPKSNLSVWDPISLRAFLRRLHNWHHYFQNWGVKLIRRMCARSNMLLQQKRVPWPAVSGWMNKMAARRRRLTCSSRSVPQRAYGSHLTRCSSNLNTFINILAFSESSSAWYCRTDRLRSDKKGS